MRKGPLLYMKVYSFLKEGILAGKYAPGDMIPTEQELMDQFDVSRITTNRALRMLSDEGLVSRRAGIGTIVLNRGSDGIESSVVERREEPVGSSTLPMVGVVIPILNGSFGGGILQTLERMASERGMAIALMASYGYQETEEYAINHLVSLGVKGLVVLPVNGEYYNQEILRLHLQKFPIVLVDKEFPGIPLSSVTSDNYTAAKSLTEHLINCGHRSIAFCSQGTSMTSSLVDRRNGYEAAVKQAGLYGESDLILNVAVPEQEQVDVLREFLISHPDVTAVLASDDYWATQALRAGLQAGRDIPKTLAIACFDSPRPSDAFWMFTHAAQNEVEIATNAFHILEEQWQSEKTSRPTSIRIPCKLNIGPSTVDSIGFWPPTVAL